MANEVYKDDANLEGLWLMEEVSGNRSDYTPNGNDLTDTNTVGSSTDCQEGSRSADFERGSSEALTIADGSQTGLDITGNISIVAWIKLESIGNDQAIAGKYVWTGNLRCYVLRVNSSNHVSGILSSDGTATTEAIGAATLSAGTWYHVGLVYDGNDIRLYVDGSLDSNGASNPKEYADGVADKASEFALGRVNAGAQYWDGLLDEVAVFSRALSAGEVASIYSDGIQDPGGVVFRRRIEGY